MLSRSFFSLAILVATISSTLADTDVVVDDFESYASSTALQAAWVPVAAPGQIVDTLNSTFLSNDTDPVAPWSNYDGQVAVFDGTINVGHHSVNQWQASPFSIAPSATQNVELTVDLAHDALTSNKKLSLGLRHSGDSTENIIELGFWNQLPQGPNGEFFQFAHRAILLPGGDNWQPYGLPESLDQLVEVHGAPPDNNVGFFHRFKAVISETDITFSLDLYADGLDNAASGSSPADLDDDGDVDGNDFLIAQRTGGDIALFEAEFGRTSSDVPGVDAIDVVAAAVTSNGFNDLRFGIPSGDGGFGGSSADPFLGVDNVSLRLVDITPALSAAAAVPEPSSVLLAWFAIAQLSLARRHR